MGEQYGFWTSFTVRTGDINYGGHMGNDKFLLLFQDARIRSLQSLGFEETHIGEGVGVILKAAHVEYLAEVFLGDELEVGVRFFDLKRTGFTVGFLVKRTSDDRVVAQGTTVMVAFDYEKRKIARVPEVFREKIDRLEP